MKSLLMFFVVLVFTVLVPYEVTIRVEHNPNGAALKDFKFKNVPSPKNDDAATNAKLVLVDGEIDGNGADLVAVTDGLLPTDEDEPAANFFFNAGTPGGRFRLEFPSVITISQVNTYSWHPNTRGPQIYKLYGSDGLDPKFNANPPRNTDPLSVGWRLIAAINTFGKDGAEGGQYGVSISDASGSIGKYRHLLFDCYVTETVDDWGNTFYSEIDVVGK